MTDKKPTLVFPCDFPIKIFGTNSELFISEITAIVRKHFPDLKQTAIQSQPSKQGNYMAITITVFAQNQESLDSLYKALTSHPDIKMVL